MAVLDIITEGSLMSNCHERNESQVFVYFLKISGGLEREESLKHWLRLAFFFCYLQIEFLRLALGLFLSYFFQELKIYLLKIQAQDSKPIFCKIVLLD